MNEIQLMLEKLGLEATTENIAMVQGLIDSSVTGLKNKNNELINKQKQFKQYEGLDLEKLLKQNEDNEVNEYLEHIKKGSGAEYLAQIKAAAKAEAEAEYKTVFNTKDEEIKSWEDKFNGLQSQNDKSLIADHLRSELVKVPGINKAYLESIIKFAENQIEVVEVDGNRTASYLGRNTKNKDGKDSTILDWASAEAKEEVNGWWLEANGGTGGAGGQNGGEEQELEDMSEEELMNDLGI